MSFSISKEGNDYQGNVTCRSSKGTPPVNFCLALDDREVGCFTATESLAAWFAVAMVPGLDMGMARCRVTNEVQNLTSDPVALVVGTSTQASFSLWLCALLILKVFSSVYCCSSPSRRRCDSGGGLSVRSRFQIGRCQAEVWHQQGDFSSCVLAVECFCPPLWDKHGLSYSAAAA